MGALFDDPAVLHHHDPVGVLHGGQAVRNDQRRALALVAVQRAVERRLHHALALGVQCAGGLVQQEQWWVLEQCPCNGDALALAARQAHAALAQKGVVAVGQRAEKVVCKRRTCCGHHLVVARVRAAVTDVVHGTG